MVGQSTGWEPQIIHESSCAPEGLKKGWRSQNKCVHVLENPELSLDLPPYKIKSHLGMVMRGKVVSYRAPGPSEHSMMLLLMSTPSSLLAPRVHGHLESTLNYNPQSDFLLQEVLSILFINFRPSSGCMCLETYRQSSQDESSWEFPDGPVVKMLSFHGRS